MSYLLALVAGAFLAGTTTGRALVRFALMLMFIGLVALGLLEIVRSL